MSPQSFVHALLRHVCLVTTIAVVGAFGVRAQEAQPPAYLAVVTGQVTLERDGVVEPAEQNMPFVAGDRLRTAAGRVEIVFPDGNAIEVGEHSELEAVSSTRVRLIAGTMDHIQRAVAGSQSATYLPQDLRTYGSTFDQYGSWQYDSPYGYVWYPTVAPDWRPYYHGSWSPIRSYGWTWIGRDPWAWPTHHYGRWGHARNAWFWIPGRTWGAAWVSWSFADDYVSWCPLGYDSRPVFALSLGHRRAWDHWTVPRRSFGARGAHDGRYARDYSVARGQSSVPGRQSSAASRQSSVLSHQSTADRRPRTGDARLRTEDSRPRIDDPRLTTEDARLRDDDSGPRTGDYRLRSDDRRLATLQQLAAPRAPSERVYIPPRSYRQQPQPRGDSPPSLATLPAATAGSIAMPRVRPGATSDYRRPATDYRPPTTDYRRPAPEYRPPTVDSRPRRQAPAPPPAAPAASGGAPASRSMPHERAAPAGGDARPRAQERSAQGQGRRR